MLKIVLNYIFYVLATYLPPCVESDPNWDTCAKNSITAAIPHIIHGDPKYRIPNLSPLDLTEVKIQSNELELILSNIKIYGVEKVKEIDEIHWDKVTNIVNGSMTMKELEIHGDYKINGRVLLLQVRGEGPFILKLSKYRTKCQNHI